MSFIGYTMKKSIMVLVLLSFIFLSSCKNQTVKEIDSEACISNGGRILNTLGGEQCMLNETDIGNIPGMQCPCVCCVPRLLQ